MNERIKELAKQARQIGEYVNYGQIRLSPEQFEQKFAELIVRECCFVGEQYADGLLDSNHYAFVNKKIKEHFGVEE